MNNRQKELLQDLINVKNNQIKHLQQENKQLKEELQKANDTLDTHNEMVKHLQERIDKAIKILNKWDEEYNGLLNKNVIYINEKEDDLFSVLKILKG